MSREDQEKWDRKYLENSGLQEERPPSRWLPSYAKNGKGKEALDLACGSGRNTIWLADRGWKVDAVDISPVALQLLTESAQKRGLLDRITTYMIDLENFELPDETYDLVVKTNYLDRDLIVRLQKSLKPGGLAIVETYMQHPDNEKKDANPDYLLAQGELPKLFASGFEILTYEEYPNEAYEMHRMMKAGIVAKKISL